MATHKRKRLRLRIMSHHCQIAAGKGDLGTGLALVIEFDANNTFPGAWFH
jgi:hypothetical protein